MADADGTCKERPRSTDATSNQSHRRKSPVKQEYRYHPVGSRDGRLSRCLCLVSIQVANSRNATLIKSIESAKLEDSVLDESVDVSGLVPKADHQTSSSVIPVRPNGDRPAWHCIGANGAFTLDDLDLSRLDDSTHVHLGGPEFLGGEAAGELLAQPALSERPRRSTSWRRATPTCWPGSPPPCRTRTTCCPTTSRCSASPAPPTWWRGAGRWSRPAPGAWPPPPARGARSWSRPSRPSRSRRTTSRSSTRPAAATRSRPASCAACPWVETSVRRRAGLCHRRPGRPGARHGRRVLHAGFGAAVHGLHADAGIVRHLRVGTAG